VIGLALTETEQENGRRALRWLRFRVGGWKTMAEGLGFKKKTLTNVSEGQEVSTNLVFRIARMAGVSVEDVISGKWPRPEACPHCGRDG
jgi:hypothetical protein